MITIKLSGGCDLSGKPRDYAKSEAESETNCCNSIRNSKLKTDSIRYNRVLSHFSGPKGRRFKSCHLDQSLTGNVVSCQAFFLPFAQSKWIFPDFADFPEKRIAKDFVGLFRILSRFPVARRLTRK